MNVRVTLVFLALAVVLAGCFSTSSSRLSPGGVDLRVEAEPMGSNGSFEYVVTVHAVPRGSGSVAWEQLQVQGVREDGQSFVIDWTERTGDVWPIVDDDSPYTRSFVIDLQELLDQGVTHLHFLLGSDRDNLLIVPIDDLLKGNLPDPDPTPDPEPSPRPDPDPTPAPPTQWREVRTLRPGTSVATDVYIIHSGRPGPTLMIVGGVHGSETSGWLAARDIVNWEIDYGTLIVIPEANRRAVEARRRTGPDGADLNRMFPVGKTPTTMFARELWNLVLEFRPDALLDLHEGWGLRRLGHRFPDGTLSVGQTLIVYDARDARSFAKHVTSYLDKYHVKDQKNYSFMIIGPPVAGSLARKAGAELGIPAFIAEPSQYNTLLETRIRWQKVFAEEFLKWYGVLDRSRTIVPKAYRASAGGLWAPSLAPWSTVAAA